MRHRFLPCFVTCILIGPLASLVALGADWPQWRGPHFDGSSNAAGLPEQLDAAGTLAWKVDLPGFGSSTPIVWGDRIFVSCIDRGSNNLLALCLDRKDGKTLWRKELGVGFVANERNNMGSPSPITDGKSVWFYFGTGDLAAFDVDGSPLWARNIQKDFGSFHVQWIYASSPLLFHGRLYVQVLQRDLPTGDKPADSYLLAIDPKTGKDLFRETRPNDAVGESKESYATPMPIEQDGKAQIILVGGDCVTAHDPDSGKELWRTGGWNARKINHWRMVPSVVAGGGLVFACAPKGGPVMAIRPDGSGDVTATHIAWKTKDVSSDVCVPLFYRERLYVLNGDRKSLSCLDPKTGEVKWSGDLGGHAVFRASPTGADGRIYCVNEAGDVSVVSAEEFKVLSKLSLGERPAPRFRRRRRRHGVGPGGGEAIRLRKERLTGSSNPMKCLATMLILIGLIRPALAGDEPPKMLRFSGYEWRVRGAGRGGPNEWDDANASVDDHGCLHLKITRRCGHWRCAEIFLERNLGFGRYQWEIEGRVDRFDPQVVLGLFNYTRPEVGPDGTNEIDIEFALGQPGQSAGELFGLACRSIRQRSDPRVRSEASRRRYDAAIRLVAAGRKLSIPAGAPRR